MTKKKQTKPELGDTIRIDWLDAQGFINRPLSECVPARATNMGKWVKDEPDFIVLETGVYHGDGNDPEGDRTAIPKGKGWIKKVTVVKKGD